MADISRKFKVLSLYAVTTTVLGIAIFYSLIPIMQQGETGEAVIPSIKEMEKPDKYSYSVTMSPMGTVYFEHIPQRVLTGDSNYNEILAATRDAHKIIKTSYLHHRYDGFYNQIPGFQSGMNWEALSRFASSPDSLPFDKELLYELKSDIHHLDPIQIMLWKGWTREDVEEISQNVGPFFANRGSRDYPLDRKKIAPYSVKKAQNTADGSSSAARLPDFDNYEVYTLWELSDKIAQVYKKQNVVAQIKAMADTMTKEIQSKLPPPEKQPKVGLLFYGMNRFTPYKLHNGGFGQAQYQAVWAQDAFDALDAYGNSIFKANGKRPAASGNATPIGTAMDLEALAACNPDVIIFPMAIYPGYNQTEYQELLKLKSDPVAKHINAIKNNRIYPGGTFFQGPIYYLFQVEMAAKQIYPELFGAYRNDQNYPPEEQLFSRQRLAKILKEAEDAPTLQ